MDVSSTTASSSYSTQVEAEKKAIEVQEQQVSKIIENASEESQKAAAQKTGLGTNLNIAG